MGKTQVISIRLDTEIVEELKKRGDISSILKQLITGYVESQGIIKTRLPSDVEELLGEFKVKIDNYINNVRSFCEEHAKIITESHDKEKDKFEYWRDICLHRNRSITRSNLNVYVKDVLFKQISVHSLSRDEKIELDKRINELIEYAVRTIYASEYPPIYPS
jgi:hypothetical protein